MEPLISTFAHDPAMAELVPMFVGVLPERVAALRAALAAEDLDGLRVQAHQLKGSAGGYGFGPITDAAAVLERELSAAALDALAAVCARAQAQP